MAMDSMTPLLTDSCYLKIVISVLQINARAERVYAMSEMFYT